MPHLAAVVWVFLAAWAARLLFLARQGDAGQPFSLLFHGDTAAFLGYARALLTGQPYDQGIPFHPPGYPYFLSLLLRLFGYHPGAAPAGTFPADGLPATALKVTMALLGALTCAVFYALARRVAGRAVALAALPLAIFSFGHCVLSTAVGSEALYLLLVLLVTLGVLRLAHAQTSGEALFGHARAGRQVLGLSVTPARLQLALAGTLGLLAAWAALTRAEFALTGLLLAAIWLLRAGRRALPPAGAFVGVFLLAMIPWTIHCYRSIGAVNAANAGRLPRPLPQLVLVTGYGPLNFATANNSYATGSFDTALIERLVPQREGRGLDLADPEVNRLYVDGYRVGLGWMASHPGEAFGLLTRKLGFAAQSLALGYLPGNVPSGLRGERRPVDQFLPAARGLVWVHVALMALGLARLRNGHPFGRPGRAARAGRTWVFLAPHVVTTLAVIVAFFGYVRVGSMLAPVVWLLAGAGLLALLELFPWPAGWRQQPAGVAAVVIAALLLIEAAGTATGVQRYHTTGSRLPGTDQINPDDLVIIRPAR